MQRIAFSAMLLSASRRASVAKRVSAVRRLDDVAQRLGKLRSGRELALGRLRPGEELIEQRDQSGARRQPLVRRGEAGLVLDRVEFVDAIECRLGDGRLGRLPYVED